MSDKIQKLTEKIYREGISKASLEAEEIIASAKKEAQEIIEKAKNKELEIETNAIKKADELKKTTLAEIKLASRQAINSLKHEIENIIVTKQLTIPLKSAFSKSDFIEELIFLVVNKWNPQKSDENSLQLLLSENESAKIKEVFRAKGIAALNEGIEIRSDNGLTNGFKIGPEKGGYVLRFTDNDFDLFFKEFIKEETTKLLFEDNYEN